jgi:hypothetical protein
MSGVITVPGDGFVLEARPNGKQRYSVTARDAAGIDLHADVVNLTSAKARAGFVTALPEAIRPGAKVAALELARLAEQVRALAAMPAEEEKPEAPVYTDADRAADWESCQHLAKTPDILGAVVRHLRGQGMQGEDAIIQTTYLAVTSRLLGTEEPGKHPVSVAVKGPSSSGKSFAVQVVLDLFPPEAFVAWTTLSERALIYTNESFVHRMLVLYEAHAMDNEMVALLLRCILSEHHIRHETVEATPQGIQPRSIVKAGPTGLLVTTTAESLHPENETRMISFATTDTAEQTRAVIAALSAAAAGNRPPGQDPGAWHALQRWLQHADNRVVIPYAEALGQLVEPVAVRLRRDYATVLNLIRSHAILHQATRRRDAEGRILATVADYVAVRALVEAPLADTTETAVHTTTIDTVLAVARLTDDGHGAPVTYTAVARHLHLDKSSARRRCETAEAKGYLVNLQSEEGRPAKLTIGESLPGTHAVLPTSGAVSAATVAGAGPVASGPATTYPQAPQGDEGGGGRVAHEMEEAAEKESEHGDAWEGASAA